MAYCLLLGNVEGKLNMEAVYGAWRYDENGQIVCQVVYKDSKKELINFLRNGGNSRSQDAILEN
jgi:hypothetical protein